MGYHCNALFLLLLSIQHLALNADPKVVDVLVVKLRVPLRRSLVQLVVVVSLSSRWPQPVSSILLIVMNILMLLSFVAR